MSGDSKEETWAKSLKDLKEAVEEGEYEQVAKLCPALIESTPDDVGDNLKAALYETYCKSLLHLKEYQKVVDLFQQNKSSILGGSGTASGTGAAAAAGTGTGPLQAAHLYALYRLEHYDEARTLSLVENGGNGDTSSAADDSATGTTSMALQHIRAQSLFHLAATKDAVEEYQRLLRTMTANSSTDDDDDVDRRMEVFTNLTATLVANATPYVRNALSAEVAAVRQQMQAFMENSSGDKNNNNNNHNEDYPYDLAYNLATWELTTNAVELHPQLDLLQQAQKACLLQNKDESPTDLQKDLAPIATNAQWGRDFWAGTTSSTGSDLTAKQQQELPPTVRAVQKLNRAFGGVSSSGGVKTLPEQPASEWNLTPLQKRIYRYNRAVLQLREGNTVDCRQSCQSLAASLQPLSNTQKKKQNANAANATYQSTASLEDAVWWESRVVVLQALCSKGDGVKLDDAKKNVQAMLDKLLGMEPSAVRDHALLYVQLHAASILRDDSKNNNDVQETIDLLKELPESIRSRKAVTASLASIYHQQGKEAEAEQLLRNTGDDQALAEFAMSQGNYADAAALYEKAAADTQDDVATARWAYALSFVDPERAQKVWKEVSPDLVDEQDSEANGAELEKRELPRLKMSKARKADTVAIDEGPSKTKRSHEAVLRMREKTREAYLLGLQQKGLYRVDRPTKPDPERWLPKFERSYARRRRNRGGPHKGAQGGVSEKDAAKLDVMARQAARSSGETESSANSTAHMTVNSAGAGRKGGRRR